MFSVTATVFGDFQLVYGFVIFFFKFLHILYAITHYGIKQPPITKTQTSAVPLKIQPGLTVWQLVCGNLTNYHNIGICTTISSHRIRAILYTTYREWEELGVCRRSQQLIFCREVPKQVDPAVIIMQCRTHSSRCHVLCFTALVFVLLELSIIAHFQSKVTVFNAFSNTQLTQRYFLNSHNIKQFKKSKKAILKRGEPTPV